jgi:hypothetical protein
VQSPIPWQADQAVPDPSALTNHDNPSPSHQRQHVSSSTSLITFSSKPQSHYNSTEAAETVTSKIFAARVLPPLLSSAVQRTEAKVEMGHNS